MTVGNGATAVSEFVKHAMLLIQNQRFIRTRKYHLVGAANSLQQAHLLMSHPNTHTHTHTHMSMRAELVLVQLLMKRVGEVGGVVACGSATDKQAGLSRSKAPAESCAICTRMPPFTMAMSSSFRWACGPAAANIRTRPPCQQCLGSATAHAEQHADFVGHQLLESGRHPAAEVTAVGCDVSAAGVRRSPASWAVLPISPSQDRWTSCAHFGSNPVCWGCPGIRNGFAYQD